MDEWKIKVAEEYAELKDRYEKLKAYNTKWEVKEHTELCCKPCTTDEEAEEHRRKGYRTDLLRRQQGVMGEYLHVLELRAALDEIDLGTPIPYHLKPQQTAQEVKHFGNAD